MRYVQSRITPRSKAAMFADPIMDQLIADLIWQKKWTARLQIGLMCLCVAIIAAFALKNLY